MQIRNYVINWWNKSYSPWLHDNWIYNIYYHDLYLNGVQTNMLPLCLLQWCIKLNKGYICSLFSVIFITRIILKADKVISKWSYIYRLLPFLLTTTQQVRWLFWKLPPGLWISVKINWQYIILVRKEVVRKQWCITYYGVEVAFLFQCDGLEKGIAEGSRENVVLTSFCDP